MWSLVTAFMMFTDARGLGRHSVPCHFWLLQRKTKMGHSLKTTKGPLVSCDPEECNKKSSAKTRHNGYTHHSGLSLAALKCRSTLFMSTERCKTESGSTRWRKRQKQHSSASVRDRSRECSFVENLHQTQSPLPSRKCALDLPTQFIGQKNCGAPVCVEEQQFGSVREPQAPVPGQTEANGHTFEKRHRTKNSCQSSPELKSADSTGQDFIDSMGHVAEDSDRSSSMHEVIFSTEVPQDTSCPKRCSQAGVRKDLPNTSDPRGQTSSYAFSSKGTPNVLRDQIQKVVVNLEEVLHGLQEVHLEMKEGCPIVSSYLSKHGSKSLATLLPPGMTAPEPPTTTLIRVVQQIDKLTSSIDLGLEDSTEALRCHSSRGRVSAPEMVSNHKDASVHTAGHQNSPSLTVSTIPRGKGRLQGSNRDQSKGTPPPAYPIHNLGLKLNQDTAAPHIRAPKSEGSAQSKRQKPPPYPLNGKAWKANKDKTPPYSGKRRLLSTTV